MSSLEETARDYAGYTSDDVITDLEEMEAMVDGGDDLAIVAALQSAVITIPIISPAPINLTDFLEQSRIGMKISDDFEVEGCEQ